MKLNNTLLLKNEFENERRLQNAQQKHKSISRIEVPNRNLVQFKRNQPDKPTTDHNLMLA